MFSKQRKFIVVLTVCKSLFLSITAVKADTTHSGANASIAISFPNGSSGCFHVCKCDDVCINYNIFVNPLPNLPIGYST